LFELVLLEDMYRSSFHRVGPLACFDLELTSETVDPFGHLGRVPWTGDQLIVRPLSTHDIATRENVDVHPCLERDSNPRS